VLPRRLVVGDPTGYDILELLTVDIDFLYPDCRHCRGNPTAHPISAS